MMLYETAMSQSYEYAKTDPNDYHFNESGANTDRSYQLEVSGKGKSDPSAIAGRLKKKKAPPHNTLNGVDPKSHLKPTLPSIQSSQRTPSNEKPSAGTTLDKIFGGNFKVVNVFNNNRDSSEEHFPNDPLSRRLSPRKQENFEIAEADEEEEDFRESRRGYRVSTYNFEHNSSTTDLKSEDFSRLKVDKTATLTSRESAKIPFYDEKEQTFRSSRVRHNLKQGNEAHTTKHSHTGYYLGQGQHHLDVGACEVIPMRQKNNPKARTKYQTTFYKESNSFHTRNCSKNSDTTTGLPPINVGIDPIANDIKNTTPRGRRMKAMEFYNTQAQFSKMNFDGHHDVGPLRRFDLLDLKRNEKENKYCNQKTLIDIKYKHEDLNLIEKYATRFQLNTEERNLLPLKYESYISVVDNTKTTNNKGQFTNSSGLMISTTRISTPYQNFHSDPKTDVLSRARGNKFNKVKNYYG